MPEHESHAEVHVPGGTVEVFRQAPLEPWLVRFLPDAKPGEPLSGRTYSPTDNDLPYGYPAGNDPTELLKWACRRGFR